MLTRFHLIPERYGQTDRQTDGQTDRFAISISRVSLLTRDENHLRTTCACLAVTSKEESCHRQYALFTLTPNLSNLIVINSVLGKKLNIRV